MHTAPESPETVISSLSPCPEKMWEPQADEEDKERISQQEDPGENVNLSRSEGDSLKKASQTEETPEDEIDDFEDGVDEMDEEEVEGKQVLLAEFSSLM